MRNDFDAFRDQVSRQVIHWTMAASGLQDLELSASSNAWTCLEKYLGIELRRNLFTAIEQLQKEAAILTAQFVAANTVPALQKVAASVVAFRDRYLRTETLVDFYGHAVNTRTNPQLGAQLRAFDLIVARSMSQLLEPLGKKNPQVLTYLERGLGASIMKAGLRLWDGTVSTAAAIKITYHNRRRPTALVHEAGHQVAHILGWNEELAAALRNGLSNYSLELADLWANWASEIAADLFAFAHTGYAAVASLCDVLSGHKQTVFRINKYDPHPTGYIRVLLGTEMCVRFFGDGPWRELADTWSQVNRLDEAPNEAKEILGKSVTLLPRIVDICLRQPMKVFGSRALAQLLDPCRVKPEALMQLEAQAGAALFTSQHWIWNECLRLLALSGLRIVTMPQRCQEFFKQQDEWMLRLGNSIK